MNHPTSKVIESPDDVTALVLVGPPACGKSTIRSLMSDYGVVGYDVDPYYSEGTIKDHSWVDSVEEIALEAHESPPRVCAIEGIIRDEDVDTVRDLVGDVLVIRVNAPSQAERTDRFVERELTDQDREAVDYRTIAKLRTTADRRYHFESPYPQHDVEIVNSDDIKTSELAERVANIVSAVSDVDRDSFTSPKATATGDL